MPSERLYLNITNHCNMCCPFCCMYSSPKKNTFMPFDTYKKILNSANDYELQIEGGEPLLHPQFDNFFTYALNDGECKKIIILTNGINIRKDILRIVNMRNKNTKNVEIKISVNNFLVNSKKRFLFEVALAVQNIEFIDGLCIKLNVRKSYEDAINLQEEIAKYNLTDKISNCFYFNRYGRLKDDGRYGAIVIKQNIADWKIYASDGKCFGQDLIKRSEYENELS